MWRSVTILAFVSAACAGPASAPAPGSPRWCIAAEAHADSARASGRLREAARTLERVEPRCPGAPRKLADLYERLGRTDALASLAARTTNADAATRAAISAARERAARGPHGLSHAEELLARAAKEPAFAARAMRDAALDEIERATGLRAEPFETRALSGPPTFEGTGRWVRVGDGGVLVDTRTGSTVVASPYLSVIDPSGRWLAEDAGTRDDRLLIVDLDARRLAFEGRTGADASSPQFLPAGKHVAWLGPRALHVVDLSSFSERTLPLDGPAVLRRGIPEPFGGWHDRWSLWAAARADGESAYMLDTERVEVRRLAAQPKMLAELVQTRGRIAVSWRGGPVQIFRAEDGAELSRIEVDAAQIAFDETAERLAWIEHDRPFAGIAEIGSGRRSRVRLVGGEPPTDYPEGGPSTCSIGLSRGDLSVDYSDPAAWWSETFDMHTGRRIRRTEGRVPSSSGAMSEEELRICALAGVDCGESGPGSCERLVPTKEGPVVVTKAGGVRVDPATGRALARLEASADVPLYGSPESTYVVGGEAVLRGWDARDGKLVWSISATHFCRVGIRLYPRELCE